MFEKKIKDGTNPSQPVHCSGCLFKGKQSATPGASCARLQSPIKNLVEKGILVMLKRVGLKFLKGKWQAHLDKYLKLKLVELVGTLG